MTYREKAAWMTLVAMVLAYSLYFGLIFAGHPAGQSLYAMLWLFGTITATQAVAVIIGSIYLAVQARKLRRARIDERDRAIARRGAAISYYALLTAMILVGVVMPFSDSAIRIVNAALFGIVVSELIRLTAIVMSYRRGWHG